MTVYFLFSFVARSINLFLLKINYNLNHLNKLALNSSRKNDLLTLRCGLSDLLVSVLKPQAHKDET